MRTLSALAVLMITISLAYGGEWVDEDKKPIPQAPNRKSQNDFLAMLVVTPNASWEKEWNTSQDTVPKLKEVEKASVGDELAVLTLFANAKPDENNTVNVICSLKVTRPNNTVAVNKSNIPCFNGQLRGPASNIQLSPAILKFTAEKTDPIGVWHVEATVEDKNRNTKLELSTQYELVRPSGG